MVLTLARPIYSYLISSASQIESRTSELNRQQLATELFADSINDLSNTRLIFYEISVLLS